MLLAGPGRAAAQVTAPTIELVAKAERQGTLRVIVEVKVDPPTPTSRETIVEAQARLLDELAGTSHRVVRRFTTIPFLALEVSADALRRLATSPSLTYSRRYA